MSRTIESQPPDRTNLLKWIAAATAGAFLLGLCFIDVRFDAEPRRGVVGGYPTLVGGRGEAHVGVHVQFDDGGGAPLAIAMWEYHRFPSGGTIWVDVPLDPAGSPSIHRPLGDWYVRTALWLRHLASSALRR